MARGKGVWMAQVSVLVLVFLSPAFSSQVGAPLCNSDETGQIRGLSVESLHIEHGSISSQAVPGEAGKVTNDRFCSSPVVSSRLDGGDGAHAPCSQPHLSPEVLAVTHSDSPLLRMSWLVSAAQHQMGLAQLKYRLSVQQLPNPGSVQQGAATWSSGWVDSSSNHHDYTPTTPGLTTPFAQYQWQVQVLLVNATGFECQLSSPQGQVWEFGPSAVEWGKCSQWVTDSLLPPSSDCGMYEDRPAPLFRRDFVLNPTLADGGSDASPTLQLGGSSMLLHEGLGVSTEAATAAVDNSSTVCAARVYASGLGYFEVYVNGQRVGSSVLDPGQTSYDKRILYRSWNVTELLISQTSDNHSPSRSKAKMNAAVNTIGLAAGNGFFNPLPMRFWGNLNLRDHVSLMGEPMVRLILRVQYCDGRTQVVGTEAETGKWLVGDSPISRNNVYLGEVFKLRQLTLVDGWSSPNFNTSGWRNVVNANVTHRDLDGRVKATSPNNIPMEAQLVPPIRSGLTWNPIAITWPSGPPANAADHDTLPPFIVDMGQNFAGWLAATVCSNDAVRSNGNVTIRYGELLNSDGTLNPMTSVAGQIKGKGIGGPCAPDVAYQEDTLVLDGWGDGVDETSAPVCETITPHFAWHGFRYALVNGLPTPAGVDRNVSLLEDALKERFVGIQLYSSVPVYTSAFESSSALFNDIQRALVWTQLSNMFSIQSDCPHRERFGYGGDVVASSETALLNMDLRTFYEKRIRDFADAQRQNGGLTETAPYVGISTSGMGDGSGPVDWQTVFLQLQLLMYRYYGDARPMKEHWNATRRYISLLNATATHPDMVLNNGLGDWMAVAPSPIDFLGTSFFYWNLKMAGDMAHVLGEDDVASEYTQMAETVKATLNSNKFLDRDTGVYSTGTQFALSLALWLDIVPNDVKNQTVTALGASILKSGEATCTDSDTLRGKWSVSTKGCDEAGDDVTRCANDYELTTGMFGNKFMLMSLSETPLISYAYYIASRTDEPSFGYMLSMNATTLWESWNYSDNTFSHNHPMFDAVGEWFVKVVVGIMPSERAVGMDSLVLRPGTLAAQLSRASSTMWTVKGDVRMSWSIVDGEWVDSEATSPVKLVCEVDIPVGTTAQLMDPPGFSLSSSELRTTDDNISFTAETCDGGQGDDMRCRKLVSGSYVISYQKTR